MRSRKQLRETLPDIYINEDLTRAGATLLYKARRAKRSARKELLTAGRLMAELLSRIYGAMFTQSSTRWSWPDFVARREFVNDRPTTHEARHWLPSTFLYIFILFHYLF